ASDKPQPPRSPRPTIEPANRFAGAVHVQRVATICALALLLFAVSSRVNAWLLAAIFAFGVLVDVEHLGGDSAIWWNVGSIMSEGINHALVFAFPAGLFAYLERATVARGVALALVLGVLLWNRPANLGLALAFAPIFAADQGRAGAKRAALRA